MPRRSKPQDVPNEAELTQYGKGRPGSANRFRDRPRAEINEPDVSLLLGRLGVEEAAVLVFKWAHPLSAVRYTTAGTLRAKGFIIRHTPSPGNSKHVSVLVPPSTEWDETLAKSFDECFTER